MSSKANVTFNIFLLSVVIILGNVFRLKLIPINNEVKKSLGYPSDSLLNFTELSTKYGYISEEHTVVTEDGHILTVFRIRGRRCNTLKRPPVILMHGLLMSADAWLDAGPNSGLAYLIANDCHDLWVGNQRGNYYSRRHVKLNPDVDPEYWQFSVDEIGFYDIPATIKYVLKYSGEKKLNYIGYSQGAGTYFIMCSERPEYCEKSNILITLAPAARQTNTKSKPYRLLTNMMMRLERVLAAAGFYEVFAKGAFGQEFLAFFCQFGAVSEICQSAEGFIDSYHPNSITKSTLRNMFGHFPAGTSAHTLARYGQSMDTPNFQKFDYGKIKNMELYGEEEPPKYNLSAVTVPFVALYGANDNLVDPKDVFWLVKQLPNVLEVVRVSDPFWNHLDVPYSQYTRTKLYPKIHEYLQKYSGV